MALMKCKECGTDVAKSAKTCPKCGAPVPKGVGTGCLTVIVGVLIFGGVMKALSGQSASTTVVANVAAPATATPAAAPPSDPLQAKLPELLSVYKDNELQGDTRFKGQWLQTTGVISDVTRDAFNAAHLKLGTGALYENPMLDCLLVEKDRAKAAQLHKGDKATVVGKVTGMVIMSVVVSDCEIR